jgi:hypothetical protein
MNIKVTYIPSYFFIAVKRLISLAEGSRESTCQKFLLISYIILSLKQQHQNDTINSKQQKVLTETNLNSM